MGGEASPAALAKTDKPAKQFEKPTLETALAFANEIGLSAHEADKFWNYYESNGWKAGRNPMRDWRAAMRGWQKRAEEYSPPKLPQRKGMQDVYEQSMATLEGLRQ